MNHHQTEAIANADAHLNNAVLPTYTELATAAYNLACAPDSLEMRRALNALLDKIPNC